ncbi:MAG: type II toxin-antitoxin system VapC family toxin [Flavisolibacter sp.]|nr:type II toxin-antitoxin system VapC family toxin [Flavisolibacter sp.]
MKLLMLDSNVVIDMLRNRTKANQRLQPYRHYKFVLSHVTYIEVLAGAQLHRKNDTEKFLRQFAILSFTIKVHNQSRQLARRYHVQKPMDLLIAAHTISEGIELLTNNTDDFERYKTARLKLLKYQLKIDS